MPDWLQSLVEWLRRYWPDAPDWQHLRYIIWAVGAALLLLVGWRVWRWWRARQPRPDDAAADAAPWRPQAEAARALLVEADGLAAQARFAEAAHLLLLRSVEQIAVRQPDAVRPALTSRDIARAPGLPTDVRSAFTLIAGLVERSLFGGSDVDAAGWSRCRAAYADAAFGRAWR